MSDWTNWPGATEANPAPAPFGTAVDVKLRNGGEMTGHVIHPNQLGVWKSDGFNGEAVAFRISATQPQPAAPAAPDANPATFRGGGAGGWHPAPRCWWDGAPSGFEVAA